MLQWKIFEICDNAVGFSTISEHDSVLSSVISTCLYWYLYCLTFTKQVSNIHNHLLHSAVTGFLPKLVTSNINSREIISRVSLK